ncbi:methyl-accepting chemotaxis protein [Alteromonas sediminis]|uniref:Methyl-accepting chemotaxis protein n=1 Tax=Alteromonas sediminis TaxID=2259342 RepID=A0A3N5XXS8_9ALTE|nr:methyl-accepting chemotaxis protein [Alteromonas sediminis]RPJ65273.1 methyl-accepting chemotaxis protein [Alteromonas sediminis]
MQAFWQLYDVIERTFFYTLTRKIIGNITFLFLFQVANFYLFYQVAATPAEERTSLTSAMITLFVLGTFSFAFTIFYLHYLIVRPVKALLNTLNDINHTRGDLSTRLPAFTRDEFREVSEAYNLFASNLSDLVHQIHNDANKSSDANQVMANVVKDVNEQVAKQKSMSHEINESTQTVSHSISNIVSASEQVTMTNKRNLVNAEDANQNLSESKQQIEKITALLQQFSSTVQGLQANAENVRNILRMVEEFADQTNLLALNAAIEAARAGEAGRGFAVVADEVRTLSAKVADATQQISHFLNDMETLVGETQEESTRLVNVSDEMQSSIKGTSDTFATMMQDFIQNIEAFKLIMSSVTALQHQHEHTSSSTELITQLSDDIQHKMQVANQEANQAKQLALATQNGLNQFVE